MKRLGGCSYKRQAKGGNKRKSVRKMRGGGSGCGYKKPGSSRMRGGGSGCGYKKPGSSRMRGGGSGCGYKKPGSSRMRGGGCPGHKKQGSSRMRGGGYGHSGSHRHGPANTPSARRKRVITMCNGKPCTKRF